MSTKRLVLFSGGLKSTFLAVLAKHEDGAELCYITDKPGDTQTGRVRAIAQHFNLVLWEVPLVAAPPLRETLLQMLYLTLHALPIAKREYCKCIYHGLSLDDDRDVANVLDQYTKQLGDLITLAQPLYDGKGGWLGSVELETPLRKLDRARVIRLGNEWNIPWSLTHSCDVNTKIHCGVCKGCKRRRRAFKQEGHEDPTKYEH